jgi:hypothetical protein
MIYPKSFYRMSEPAMRRHLLDRNVPPSLADGFIATEQARRNATRPIRKKREQHLRLWQQLIDPAVAELRNVQHMLKLTLTYPTPERTAALSAYAALLALLIGKLKLNTDKLNVDDDLMGDDLLTPRRQASKPTKAFPHGKPNGGAYWVDWVPPSAVRDIQDLFAVIPVVRGVKRKHPFPVVLDKATSAKRRAALIERTTKEIEHIERSIAVELADPRLTDTHVFKHQEIGDMRVQVSRMQSALHVVSLLPPNAFIPPTWHSLLVERTPPGTPPLPQVKAK